MPDDGASPPAPAPMDFLVLCQGRTGSNLLRSLLDSHPEISCDRELFHPDRAVRDPPLEYLGRARAERGSIVAGFKLTSHCMLHRPGLAAVVPQMAARVIVLRRPHYLAQMVSGRLATSSERFHREVGAPPEPQRRVRLPADRVVALCRRMRLQDELLAPLARNRPLLEIEYRGGFAEADMAQAQSFLDVRSQPLVAGEARVRIRPLAETVVNWDEISATLTHTEFEWMLSEERDFAPEEPTVAVQPSS